MDLLKKPSNTVVFGGKQYTINYSFDNILLIFKLIKDSRISNGLKYIQIYNLLEPKPKPKASEIFDFVSHVLNDYIFKGGAKSKSNETPTFDFILDGSHIYTSFLQDYGIDLYEQRGKMHFEIFKALFQDLSPDTAIKRIIEIRTCKIPRVTKHNRDEVNRLRQLKLQYSLSLKEDPDIQQKRFEEKMIRWIDGVSKKR